MIFELQKAVVEKLLATQALSAFVGTRIFDALPDPLPPFPYVTFGEPITAPWDTKTTVGLSEEITLHVWSQYRGKKEAQQIMDVIRRALDRQPLAVAGWRVMDVRFAGADNFMDADGFTRHGVCRFDVQMTEGE